MDVLTLSLVALVGLPFRSEAPSAEPPCAWSAVWPKLNAGRYRAVPTGAALVEPPRKVKVTRPPSDVKRKMKGNWKIDLVIDQTGAVRDVRIAERPKIDPEWPEFEAHVQATVKATRLGPALVDGQPWPHCMTVTVKD
jgi:hypothetical protein